ncbi:hypothetical protein P171DRAFT_474034 [Karstenula rhodostoma CBS 690.94]|uniref:Uncharacterized protein n=1 Tax=Karstenula rhodostoma CBS 690.94 TaxID=1392251 RepID=A0A9P4UC25_9PLEO|nr:hypothetical protein P171DRAFT_474034 [Karstenula rhodostoma CBS 690.94]
MPGASGGGRGRVSDMTGDGKKKAIAKTGSGSSRAVAHQLPSSSKISGNHRTESEEGWLRRICDDARKNSYMTGLPTFWAQEMWSYDEDDAHPAPKSAKALDRLKVRFLGHLALAFGERGVWNSPTIAMVREDFQNSTAIIRLSRMSGAGERSDLKDAGTKFAQAFTTIHESFAREHISEWKDLDEVVFRLYKSRILEAAGNLRTLWWSHQDKIHNTIAKMSGLYDDDGYTSRDDAIGDAIVGLNGSIIAIISARPTVPNELETRLKALVLESYKLFQLEGSLIRERLRSVLGSSLADGIYDNIQVLIQPTKSVQTFVRTAQALKGFRTVQFKRGDPSACDCSSPLSSHEVGTASQVGVPASSQAPHDTQHHVDTDDSSSSVSPCSSSTDHEKMLSDIHPSIKSAAWHLLAFVLKDRVPEPESEGYYLFGFPACRNEDEIQKLGGLYRAILTSMQTSVAAVLTQVCHAVIKCQLPQVFGEHRWESFRAELPYLEGFVTTPTEERATVFRLVQFLRSKSDSNPPPVLIRDYGFHLCRMREEVEVLKDIYRRTLGRLSVFDLHHACITNTLLETVQGAGILFELKHRRFLKNQGPRPQMGYEKNTLPFQFDQGIFKNKKIKRRGMQLN